MFIICVTGIISVNINRTNKTVFTQAEMRSLVGAPLGQCVMLTWSPLSLGPF